MRGRILILCLSLLLIVVALCAPTSSPLQTKTARVGPYEVLLSFYSLPRVAQELQLTVGSSTPGEAVRIEQAMLEPARGTDSNIIRAVITPTSDTPGVYNVNVTPPVRGAWLLHLTVSGARGTYSADIPLEVQGPPAIPTWLGWLIGMTPIPFIVAFIWSQVRWRAKKRAEVSVGR